MGHIAHEKQKLLNRVRRLRGQLDAIERTVEQEGRCVDLLQQITSARGAMNGLLAVVLEDHIRSHLAVVNEDPDDDVGDAREQLIDIVHSYFK
jgi:DNA-binding FrmR family transcriptional regulator